MNERREMMVAQAPEMEIYMQTADHFYKSGLFKDVASASQAYVKIMAGHELGVLPFASMQNIDILLGRVYLKPVLLASLINKSNLYSYKAITQTDTEAVIEFYRKNELIGTSKYTIEDAKKARLIKEGGGYDKTPSDMLFWRAMSRGYRRFCPELSSFPIYVIGEEVEDESKEVPQQKEVPNLQQIMKPKPQVETPQSVEFIDPLVIEKKVEPSVQQPPTIVQQQANTEVVTRPYPYDVVYDNFLQVYCKEPKEPISLYNLKHANIAIDKMCDAVAKHSEMFMEVPLKDIDVREIILTVLLFTESTKNISQDQAKTIMKWMEYKPSEYSKTWKPTEFSMLECWNVAKKYIENLKVKQQMEEINDSN